MIRAAILGLGWWGQTLNRRLRASRRIKATHGVDPALERLKGNPGLENLELLASYDALLSSPAIDAVIVATPHALHERQVIDAARHGKHVFCEKPLNLSAAGARRMAEACRENGVILGVGHERRFEPALSALAGLVSSGTLGRIAHVDCNWSHDGVLRLAENDWRKDPAHAPAGLLTGLGVHITDWFQSVFGPVGRVAAETVRGSRMGGTDETVAVKFAFESGVLGWLCCLSVTPFYFRLAVFGDKGWAEVRQDQNVDVATSAAMEVRLTGGPIERHEFEMGDQVLANLEAWAEAVEGGAPYPNTPLQMVHNVEILEAIVTSAREGRPVDIGELRAHS